MVVGVTFLGLFGRTAFAKSYWINLPRAQRGKLPTKGLNSWTGCRQWRSSAWVTSRGVRIALSRVGGRGASFIGLAWASTWTHTCAKWYPLILPSTGKWGKWISLVDYYKHCSWNISIKRYRVFLRNWLSDIVRFLVCERGCRMKSKSKMSICIWY